MSIRKRVSLFLIFVFVALMLSIAVDMEREPWIFPPTKTGEHGLRYEIAELLIRNDRGRRLTMEECLRSYDKGWCMGN